MATRPATTRLSATDRRQQILQVATQLFARQGFNGTTTRQIAEKARVNEAIIFRHFPTKDDLYWGVLDEKVQRARSRHKLEERFHEKQEARELFIELAEDLLSRDTTMSRLLMFSALENHRLAGRFFQTYIATYYEKLAEHIGERIAAGEFRQVDPLLAARGFLGMLVYHFWIQEIYGGKRYQNFEQRQVAETLVDIWLTGITSERLSESGTNGKNGR